jgi:radical SAM protein with 4Fe4S-binding SPASM domain
MRVGERISGIARSPKLLYDILIRGRYDFNFDQMPLSMRRMAVSKRWNLVESGLNFLYRRLDPWSMPIHMQFELVNYCGLHCPVCPTGRKIMVRPRKAVEVDLFTRVLDEVGPYLLTLSLWGWGEPLLHPQLRQILSAAHRHRIVTLLSTNGQLLNNEEIIQDICEFPPTWLIVAIDGLTDATNSTFRKGATLETVREGVRKIAEIKKGRCQQFPVLHMRFMIMKHNEHEVAHVADFARENHFDFLTLRTLSIIMEQDPDAVHHSFVPDSSEYRAYQYKNNRRISRNGFVCQQPFWFPTVFADGTLVACEQDYQGQLPMGVINDKVSFSDLWYSRSARSVRKNIRDDPESSSFCRSCPFIGRSSSDCSIKGVLLNSDMSQPLVV